MRNIFDGYDGMCNGGAVSTVNCWGLGIELIMRVSDPSLNRASIKNLCRSVCRRETSKLRAHFQ